MPPTTTAAVRRRPAIVARERNQVTPGPDRESFFKPNLPALEGTPSARRQYGYGADAEPSPARRRDVVDLSDAIKGALDRQKRQQAQQAAQKLRRQSDADLFLDEATMNEIDQEAQRAADLQAMPPPSSFTPLQGMRKRDTLHYMPRLTNAEPDMSRHVGFASLIEQRDESDTDDARSFSIESNYYGDATIASTPGSAPPSELRQRASAMSQRRAMDSQRSSATYAVSITPATSRQSSNAENELPSPLNNQDTPGLRSNPRRPKPKRKGDAAAQSAEAPAQPRRPASKNAAKLADAQTRPAKTVEPSRRAPLRQRSGNSDHGRDQPEETTAPASAYRPSLFAQAKNLAASASPFSSRSHYASDHSEIDDALQRDIQSNAGESIDEDEQPPNWQERWTWTKPLQSLPFLRRDAPQLQPAEEPESDDEVEVAENAMDDTINWWQLLNPYTYFQAFCWIVGAAYSSVADFLASLFPHKLVDGLSSLLEVLLYSSAAIIGLVTVISITHAALFGKIDGDFSMDRLLSVPDIHWEDIVQAANKVQGLIPEFSWPVFDRSNTLPDLTQLDDDGLARLGESLAKYQREFEQIQKAGKLRDGSLKKLESILPMIIHVPLRDGKVVVAPDFWHAMRDRIHTEGDVLTVVKKGGAYEIASEAHWKAIQSRITTDPSITRQINATVDRMEERVKSGAASYWDSWVKKNDDKIAEMLGNQLDKIQSAGSQREFDKRLRRIVKEQIDEKNKDSSVVSREEFMRHLSNEFATHRAEVRAELAEMQPQLDEFMRQAAELANKATPESMTKAEIVTLVHGMVNKAVTDLSLDAMARGQIRTHWDSVLKHQINYFGVGAGAVIDKQHSSVTFEAPAGSQYVKQKGLKGVQRPIPRIALESWTDEGDCWCAARSQNHRGNPHGAILAVMLGHRVVPQHIVVEHIVAGATTDPDARPKEIEMYANVDPEIRDVVRAFSAAQFPDIYPVSEDGDWNVSPAELPERFVKIAQFVYEDVQPHDGVQVHRLSDELMNLGVTTDHVIVRAVSNYGAKTHTCFYRVRLYGQRMDDGLAV